MAQRKRYSQLPNTILPGLVNFPTTPAAQKLTQELLEEDREGHHCLFHPVGLHNHLSHHILAAYDFGASAQLLQAIYDDEKRGLLPIDTKFQNGENESPQVNITVTSWTEHLGKSTVYASYLTFFSDQIRQHGTSEVFSRFFFSKEARAPGVDMLHRFLAGLFHPLIQSGYGAEFGSDAMIAQGLAQGAIHAATYGNSNLSPCSPSTQTGTPLLEIMKQFYESDVLKPVMPYDPDALLSKRIKDAMANGRPEKILELSALWFSRSVSDAEIDRKVEELFWLSTLLLVGTSKRGRKPRLDFFLMHILTSTSFLPSLLKFIPKTEHKQQFLESYLPIALMTLIVRGRPRIDCGLVMGYSALPKFDPAAQRDSPDALVPMDTNPWLDIVREVVHTKEAHIMKSVRALYIGAQKYGGTAAGGVPGAEALEGGTALDGTIFVRAARVVMDVMGWVTRGEKEGSWDRSALGWDDAWKENDKPSL